MDNDRLINAALLAAFLAIAGFVLLAMAGCATPQSGNPTDTEQEIEQSGQSNTIEVVGITINQPAMGDFTQTLTDMLKDLLKGLPAGELGEILENVTRPAPVPPSVDGRDNNTVDNPVDNSVDNPGDGEPDEPDVPDVFTGADLQTLNKPKSESTGKLVLLLAAPHTASSVTLNGEAGNLAGRSNEHRQTWRFSKPGAAYGGTATYKIALPSGVRDLTVHPGQRQTFDVNFKHIGG